MAIHLDSTTVTLDKPIVWAYRLLALAWIIKGYLGWYFLMAVPNSGFHLLASDGWLGFFAMVVMPILDIVAGVSLWISWRWGSGVWASVAIVYMGLALSQRANVHSFIPLVAVGLLLIAHFARMFVVRSKVEKRIKIL